VVEWWRKVCCGGERKWKKKMREKKLCEIFMDFMKIISVKK
jgi:hypothetical protein